MVFEPLGMSTTFFNPPKEKKHRIVPTEISQDRTLSMGMYMMKMPTLLMV
jgi:CubicO group peptidase (beta-lactamase class C family)